VATTDRVLLAIMLIGCIVSAIYASLHHNVSGTVGWYVATLGWANVAFRSGR
jgi:hypothetical protein